MLETYITSKIRREILANFLLTPKASFHIRDLGRIVGTEINAVRRELLRLSKAGLLHKRHSGNRLYYEVSRDYPFLNSLTKLLSCDYGFGGRLVQNKAALGEVRFALVSFEFLRGRVSRRNQIDLLLIGRVNIPFLEDLVRQEQIKREQEINYTILTEEEFSFQKSKRDPLLIGALSQARVILWGDEERYCGVV
jgi:DNA-binding transcriptional ArsR family regulator